MLEPLFQSFEKLIDKFTWRRLLFLLSLISLITIGLWLFESYTSHFKLAKIQKVTKLIGELSELSTSESIQSDKKLSQIYDSTLNELEELSNEKQINIDYVYNPTILKFFTGALLWLVFALFYLPGAIKGNREGGNVILGAFIFALIFGLIGAILPTFHKLKWINYVVYPISSFLLCAIILIQMGKRDR